MEVVESHTFCHLITILGPRDIDDGGVEATDVTVKGVLLPRLCLLAGVHEERWCFQKDKDMVWIWQDIKHLLSFLKGQFSPKSKFHIFPLTCTGLLDMRLLTGQDAALATALASLLNLVS